MPAGEGRGGQESTVKRKNCWKRCSTQVKILVHTITDLFKEKTQFQSECWVEMRERQGERKYKRQ